MMRRMRWKCLRHTTSDSFLNHNLVFVLLYMLWPPVMHMSPFQLHRELEHSAVLFFSEFQWFNFSSCFFPEFPLQQGNGVEAGGAGGDAAGSEEEGGPGCQAAAPAGQEQHHEPQERGRVRTGQFWSKRQFLLKSHIQYVMKTRWSFSPLHTQIWLRADKANIQPVVV